MIKITPKGKPGEERYSQGYELMQLAFMSLVFCGNLAGSAPAGTAYVLIDGDADTIRKAITDVWMECHGIDRAPDEVLALNWC